MRRICLGFGVAAIALIAGCHAGRGAPISAAQSYFEQHLHLDTSTVIGSRSENECAVVALRAPDGRSQVVAVVFQGKSPRWEAVGMSPALHLADYRDDGNVACGYYNVNRAAALTGRGLIVGSFRTAGGPTPSSVRPLAGRIEAHAQTRGGKVAAANTTYAGGRFEIVVPPGRYWLTGHSHQVAGEDCLALRAVVVRVGHTSHTNVFCQIR